jgi:hypothetical protein
MMLKKIFPTMFDAAELVIFKHVLNLGQTRKKKRSENAIYYFATYDSLVAYGFWIRMWGDTYGGAHELTFNAY